MRAERGEEAAEEMLGASRGYSIKLREEAVAEIQKCMVKQQVQTEAAASCRDDLAR